MKGVAPDCRFGGTVLTAIPGDGHLDPVMAPRSAQLREASELRVVDR